MAIDAQRECSRPDRPGTLAKGERAQSAVGNRRQLVGVGVEQQVLRFHSFCSVIRQSTQPTPIATADC